jgi:hypothetical protein
MNIDLLIAACTAVLSRPSTAAPWQNLDENDPEPYQLDERLARFLGFEATTGRALVLELFGAVPSPEVAIQAAMGEYMEWARGAVADADEAYLGESPAAPR